MYPDLFKDFNLFSFWQLIFWYIFPLEKGAKDGGKQLLSLMEARRFSFIISGEHDSYASGSLHKRLKLFKKHSSPKTMFFCGEKMVTKIFNLIIDNSFTKCTLKNPLIFLVENILTSKRKMFLITKQGEKNKPI